jgi:hypothetical protein
MFLFSTPLFINGLPVDYNVYKQGTKYLFEPAFNSHKDLVAPEFGLKYDHQLHIFDPDVQEDIKAQAEEIIKEYLTGK